MPAVNRTSQHPVPATNRVDLAIKNGAKLEAAVKATMADVTKIQHRLTRDLRVEDGIKSLGLAEGGVTVTLKVGQPYDQKLIKEAVTSLLQSHGIKKPNVSLIPSMPPAEMKKQAAVDEAWMSIFSIQHRLTTDIRAEDDIVGMRLEKDLVHVMLRPHTNFDDKDIKAVVVKQLADHGFKNAKIDIGRPAIDPIFIHPPGPVTGGLTVSPAQAGVAKFAHRLDEVHHRLTEELRIEDGIKSVKLKGAKVELTLNEGGPYEKDKVVAFAKEELKKLGVKLPVTVKTAATHVPAGDLGVAKSLYKELNAHGSALSSTPAGKEPQFDSPNGLFISPDGNPMLELRIRFSFGGAPMPVTSAMVDPKTNTYYTRTDDPMGRTGSRWEGPAKLPVSARFHGGDYSAAMVKRLNEAAQKGVPVDHWHGPPRP